jgi:O-antigen/teichoic acid export membrane protein
MRLLRRNAIGVYAVYATAILSGLVVTPIVIHQLGTEAFGIWSFIGSVTIYLSVLDFGVGPTIVRFGAEARGRRAPEDLNAVASVGLALYAAIGLVTIPIGIALAFLVPVLIDAPDDLVTATRVATLLTVLGIAARFPLGLFTNLLVAQQRWDVQNLANFVSGIAYMAAVAIVLTSGGGLVALALIALLTTLLRLLLPLLWLRSELPGLQLARRYVRRARVRELAAFSGSNFLVHVANKIVFSTDVVVVGIVLGSIAAGVYSVPAKLFVLAFGLGTAVTSLMFPAFAELEGAGARERQRSLLLAGLRGGMALMLLLALPFLFIPDLLIHGWVGGGFEEGYPVLSLLAVVLLLHQPIYVLTQFLIARAWQRPAALISIAMTAVNLVLSVVLAATVGLWGVALSTLLTDAAALVLVTRVTAPVAFTSVGELTRASARPVVPALAAALVVLVGAARIWSPDTLLTLVPLGVAWALAGGFAIWRFGLDPGERAQLGRQLRGTRRAAEPAVEF